MTSQSDTTTSLLREVQRLVDLILRYIASGGSAILAFGVIQGRNFEFLRAGSTQQDVSGWLLLLYVSVLGIAIYAIHTSILFRLIHGALIGIVSRFLKPPRGLLELARNIRDLLIKHRNTKPPHPWSRTFDSWAAESHFLYCSAWGTFFAVALATAIEIKWESASTVCLFIGIALLIAALVHDALLVLKIIEKYGNET